MNIVRIRFVSKVLFMRMMVTVVLPDTVIESAHKRKVLWLLHGAGQDSTDCIQNESFLKVFEGRDLIVAAPDGLNSDFGNYESFGTGFDFPGYFFNELMPFIQKTFPASAAPEDNYIAGASMGGFGALMLGLQHPECFAGLAAFGSSLRESRFLEAYLDEDIEKFREEAIRNPRKFPTEYGDPKAGIKRKEVNVISKYPSVRAFFDSPECMWNRFKEKAGRVRIPDIYVACGTEDLFYPAVVRFREMAEEDRDHVHFIFAEGIGHDEVFFEEQLGASLNWFGL